MGRIVWLASYPKSGNTWLRALLANYLAERDQATRINDLQFQAADESKPNWYLPHTGGRPPASLEPAETAALRERVHADIAAATGRGDIFVKTHNRFGSFEGYALHNLSVSAGAIYMVRNPLDIVPSLADHFGLDLDAAIEFMGNEATGSPGDEANVSGILGSWSGHAASWLGCGLPLRVLRYEDLHIDGQGTLGFVTKFLGLGADAARLRRAIEHSAFAELRRQEDNEGFVERSPWSRRFFRAGQVDQWRTALSRAQVDRVVARHQLLMQRFGYLP